MGPYINRAPIRDSRATRRAPAGDYMLRAAFVVTHFFLGENRHGPKNDSLFGFIVTRQTATYDHSNRTAILCKGV